MLTIAATAAHVPGLFSQFQAARSLELMPDPFSRLSDRLALLGPQETQRILALVEKDRDNWGQRLRVIGAIDDSAKKEALALFI